jgi:hypothetical protein
MLEKFLEAFKKIWYAEVQLLDTLDTGEPPLDPHTKWMKDIEANPLVYENGGWALKRGDVVVAFNRREGCHSRYLINDVYVSQKSGCVHDIVALDLVNNTPEVFRWDSTLPLKIMELEQRAPQLGPKGYSLVRVEPRPKTPSALSGNHGTLQGTQA